MLQVSYNYFLTSKRVSSGSSGAIRAMGPSMSGEDASVSSRPTVSLLGLLGGKLSPNPRVTFVPVEIIKASGWTVSQQLTFSSYKEVLTTLNNKKHIRKQMLKIPLQRGRKLRKPHYQKDSVKFLFHAVTTFPAFMQIAWFLIGRCDYPGFGSTPLHRKSL